MQKGACYIRVSTNDQIEYSPDAQLKAIKKYCKDNNILLDNEHVYIDEGISGRKAEKRPAFQDMIKHAKKKEFDVILVHKFDRFARSREDSVVYKSLLKKECNIRVVSITESIEDDKFTIFSMDIVMPDEESVYRRQRRHHRPSHSRAFAGSQRSGVDHPAR